VWPAAMIVWGPGFSSACHSHHCIQVIIALRGTLSIRGGPEDEWVRCGAVLVRPDAVHEVDARGTTVLIGFVDPETEVGAALSGQIQGGGDISYIAASRVARWRSGLCPTLNEESVERWIRTELLHDQSPVKIHPGVNRVLKYLRQRLGRGDDVSLGTLAAIAGLSPSRFAHVFTQSIGAPLRPYILWLRLQRASCEMMNGSTATTAAHRAGFSDAAHMTRTFRRMLGTTPTQLALRKKMGRGISVE
jgi:AraC-like DNA-binding protein